MPGQSPPSRQPAHGKHQFFVSGCAEIRAVGAKMLTDADYTITCAVSTEDALQTVNADRAIDLLLTDLDMSPDMWGDELA